MIEERNQKNDFFNERIEELEKNLLILSNEVSSKNHHIYDNLN